MAYFLNVDRFGNEIENGGGAPDFNPTPINYTPAASGNTQNLNSFVVDPNGDLYFIDEDGESFKINTSNPIDVLTTVQPTPTPTGNTTNLNTAFKDASGNTWVVDYKGDAILCGSAPFKNLNEFHVDPNGNDTTGDGSQENPYKTISKALSVAGQGDQVIVHAGVYNENVTISTPNVALIGAQGEYGSLTQINGSISVTANGTSVKVADIRATSVTHTGAAPLYLENTTLTSTFTSSSSAYVEINDSTIQDGSITKSAGSILIEQSKIDNVNITGVNTAAIIRDSYQDPNSAITIGAGSVYSLNNVQGGEIVLNAGSVPLETAALAQGLSAEMAKEAETSDFMKLGMLRPDTEANPTKIVTWDEATGRLEVSDASAFGSQGAPVTVGTEAPTGSSIEGAIHLVTDNGTPTGTVLEQYIYDTDSGLWVEMMRNAKSLLKFGTTAPTNQGDWDGEEYFVTSDGTSTGTVLEQWIWDDQSSTWVQRPTPVAELTTTTLIPKVYNGTGYVNAQADAEVNLADLIQLSDGSYIQDGKVTFTAHGYEVGKWYYLSQTTAGAVISTEPISGWSQQLFFVEDANTLHIDIEPGEYVDAPVGEDIVSPYMVTATSNANYTLPGSFTPDVNRYNTVVASESLGGADADFNTSTYRFTPKRAGWYDVTAAYSVFRGSTTVDAYIMLRKNGFNIANSGSFGVVAPQVRKIVYMNGTTDYLEGANQGGALNPRQQFPVTSFFQARWLHY